MSEYPHMCRDGHPEIGHSDSESEMCPLCLALAENAELRADRDRLNWMIDQSNNGDGWLGDDVWDAAGEIDCDLRLSTHSLIRAAIDAARTKEKG